MPLTVTSPRNTATRVEVLGGRLLTFDAGVATVDGALLPAVEADVKRRGYRIGLELEHVVEDQADELAVVETADGVEHVGILPTSAATDLVDDLAAVDELLRRTLPPVPPAPAP